MAKTMINIKPVKSNSEHHNFRNEAVSNRRITKSEIDGIDFHKTTKTGIGDFKTDYVRTGLSKHNETWSTSTIAAKQADIKDLYAEKVKQKWQVNTNSIREGIIVLSKRHQLDDVTKICDTIREK